ncbi:MAG: hypothetical protein INR65_05715 [Gluconacetobacter diazotrophicus]|nr:hypothetical protein [Gluconacetobacter diazotrophicus]
MHRCFLVLWLLPGLWPGHTASAQSQPASGSDSPFLVAPSAPSVLTPSFKKIPRNPDAAAAQLCYDNGWERLRRGDNAGAEAEFSRLIQLLPAFGRGYTSRANARRKQQNLAGALADCTQAIAGDPDDPTLYRARALTQMLAHRWTEASADLQVARIKSTDDNGYLDLSLWIVRMRLGEAETANERLAAFLDKPSAFDAPGEWVCQVGRFLLDRETEADLLAGAAKTMASGGSGRRPWFTEKSPGALASRPDHVNGPLCEAWFYSGMKLLLAGDRAAAAEHFRQCLATKQLTFIEYELAEAELRGLEP